MALASTGGARTIDSVAAFVDDYAITGKDLDAAYAMAAIANSAISRDEVLDSAIDRYLLLREAHRAHIDFDDEDKEIAEFLNIKIRSAVMVPEDRSRDYYDANREAFNGKPYDQVRDGIEQKLSDEEFERRLGEFIKQLRAASRIRLLAE